jgi:L-iditol 2-dehydrogenase
MSVATQIVEAPASTTPIVKLQYTPTNESFVLTPDKQFHFENRPIPKLRTARDVRVRIIATGLCGSDVRINQYIIASSH